MRRRSVFTTSAAAAGLTLVAACAPGSNSPSGGSGSSSGSGASDGGAINTDVDALGDVTLVMWDQEVRGSQNDALEALIAGFQKQHPNITIERVKQSNEDLQRQIGLALSGNDVPDIAQVNNARGDMGTFVADGLLTDLTPYAQAYGWEDRFPASVLAKTRYSADGVTFGEGSLYGLPQTGEVCGIFLRPSALEHLGGSEPATWDELFALVDSALEEGIVPITLGNLDQWPALHVFGPLQANYVSADEITALGMGNAGADWTSEGNVQALEKLAEWGSSGALGEAPNALGYDDAWAEFAKGDGLMLIGGSWLGTDLANTMGDDLRFLAPPPGVDGTVATTGGTGIPFAIPAAAQNADAAAAFLDYITSEEAMQIIAENGGVPVLRTAELAPETGISRDIFTVFDAVSQEGTLLPYLDYATATFADTAGAALQEVIGGQSDAATAAETLQADYAEHTNAS